MQNIFASILAASWRQASMCAGGFTRRWSRSRPVLCIVYDVSSCAYYEPWSRSRLVFQTNCIPHVHSDRILSCLIRGRISKIQVASYLWSPLCSTRVSQKKQKSEFWYATYPTGFGYMVRWAARTVLSIIDPLMTFCKSFLVLHCNYNRDKGNQPKF